MRGMADGTDHMQLSLETYSLIVKYVTDRENLASLCRVSKTLQKVAESKLYNDLELRDYTRVSSICRLLSNTPRLATLVETLSIHYVEGSSESGSDESLMSIPEDFWDIVASALEQTTRLQTLNIYIDAGDQAAQSWILDHSSFQLRSFHCDLSWDEHLSTFLDSQTQLSDLYLLDFRNDLPDTTCSTLHQHSLPKLSILECTFMEAAAALCPSRPITRLKTCFSKSKIPEKRMELRDLFTKLQHSCHPLRTLDIADSSYAPEFTMELLNMVVSTFTNTNNLRYLGTLVLPVGGRERIEFYGSLMRLHKLQCVEVEITEWEPPPTSMAALRALTLELRIYCPSILQVVFVHEFDRMVMKMSESMCILDEETNTDTLWRDI